MPTLPDPDRDLAADPLAWSSASSGGPALRLAPAASARVTAMRLDYDFRGGGGFVVAHRAVRRTLPEDFVVRFRIRGHGAVNHLELKLVDASGANVWRQVTRDLAPPRRWRRIAIRSRDLDFAWGPAGDSRIGELGAIEFALVAGEGGSGSLWLAELEIDAASPAATPTARASSAQRGHEAAEALGGRGWRPGAGDARPWLVIDAGAVRTFGGLVVDWLGAAPASGYTISGSNGGRRWKTLHTVARAGGARSYAALPGTRKRFLRLTPHEAIAGAALRLGSFEFSRSSEAFWQHIAVLEPRGWYPRWLLREQSLWTPAGHADGQPGALVNEDGLVELEPGGCSIEPMLHIDGRLQTWADVRRESRLGDGWMPVPEVCWHGPGWRLRVIAETTTEGRLRLRYEVGNLGREPLVASLFLVLRPFQVTPPWQRFRAFGGISPIHELAWRDGAVQVDNGLRVVPLEAVTGFGAMAFDDGCLAAVLATGQLPPNTAVHDERGFATGALHHALRLEAGATRECRLACVPAGATMDPSAPAFDWRTKLRASTLRGADWAGDAIAALMTATAHILATRAGPALQPGARRYTRAWIRDATIMAAALLRMGCVQEVRDFIRWYAPHQRADGFVPCCVDDRGADWLVEHDSHGQLIALIADYHAFTGDRALLIELWPTVDRAVSCIERLISSDEHGLLPASVSHEGYLAQPVHSFWDDCWALRGLHDAAALARALGHLERAQHCESLAARLAAALSAAIRSTRERRGIDFIPASLELGDADPTATANAVMLLALPNGIERPAIERSFDHYLERWRRQRSGALRADKYSPYEIRIIGALVRLGRRGEALELLRFFLSDRRPRAWNQWPEIAWPDAAAPAFLGDLPHSWVAAEYVLALRSLFVYEREADHALVLAAGAAAEWLAGDGLQVDAAATLYGPLSYTLRRLDAQTLRFEIGAGTAAKLVLRPPLATPLQRVSVNGADWTGFDRDSVTIHETPAVVICHAAGPA